MFHKMFREEEKITELHVTSVYLQKCSVNCSRKGEKRMQPYFTSALYSKLFHKVAANSGAYLVCAYQIHMEHGEAANKPCCKECISH
jgi:hypothetical protein